MSDDVKKVIPCDGTPEGCHGDSDKCDKDPASCLANSSLIKQVDNEMDDCLGRSLDQLSKAFMTSAKRWEMIVYPAMFAFIVLATYGFFLIYSLTTDIHVVAKDMNKMTVHMEKIVMNMETMSKNMVVMTQTIDSQSASMKEMTYYMRGMSVSVGRMGHDFSTLNNSVSRPMQFMNDFMPW